MNLTTKYWRRLPWSRVLRRIVRNSLLAVVLAVPMVAGFAVSPADRPNIVLIMSDDMGFSDLGCYGGEIRTPHLDRLAHDGLRFTQFYNTARCCPTRASLLTGLYPHQAGMGHMTYDGGRAGYEGDLSSNAVTIAEALKPAGYAAYMAGKWHVTRHDGKEGPKDNWPRQRGFDRFYGTIKGGGNFYDPTSLTRENTFITPVNDPEYRPDQFYYTDAISDNAVKFLQDHQRQTPGQPFFLYVAYTAAHWPMHALPADIAQYRGQYDQGYEPVREARFQRLRQLGLIDPDWQLSPPAGNWAKEPHRAWEARCMEVYAAMVTSMDRGIGRLVTELQRQRQLANTLIMFLQDNGGCAEGMGRGDHPAWRLAGLQPMGPDDLQPNIWPPMRTRDGRPVLGGPDVMPGPPDTYIGYGRHWANVSNTPFREYKHWVHEGGIATPLIMHWPARIATGGEQRQQPGHLIDIMATCLDVAGAAYPTEYRGRKITPLEGRSLVPALANRPIERDAIYWEHEGNRAIRIGDWKLVAKGPSAPWELYDLSRDRTEMRDFAEIHSSRVRQMAAQWEAWAQRARVLPWIWKPQFGEALREAGSAETRFQLRAGDRLSREQAPRIQGRAFTVTAQLATFAPRGVLVAQGGTADGFAVYLNDGHLVLAIRRAGNLAEVKSPEPLAGSVAKITVELERDGTATLSADDARLIACKTPGPLAHLPIDGLEVGRDDQGAVGEYPAPFAYGGKIGRVLLELR